jgi:uracil-DNA glycosylase
MPTEIPSAVRAAFPGLRVVASLDPPEPVSVPGRLAVARAQARRRVASCRSCGLVAGCQGPVPAYYPPTHARTKFAVIGEAPGPDEDKGDDVWGRQPFIGRSGQLLRRMMRTAGIDDVDEVAWLNVVSCFPHEDEKVREPSKVERDSCQVNMVAQLNAANTGYVLLVGNTAVHQWRTNFGVTEVAGRIATWRNRWVIMPIVHPAALLRSGSKVERVRVTAQLKRWREVVDGEVDWSYHLPWDCVAGDHQRAEYWDEDAVGYCVVHWDRGRKSREDRLKEKVKLGVISKELAQEEML